MAFVVEQIPALVVEGIKIFPPIPILIDRIITLANVVGLRSFAWATAPMTAHPAPLLIALRTVHVMTSTSLVRGHSALRIGTRFDMLRLALPGGLRLIADMIQLFLVIQPCLGVQTVRWRMRVKAATETEAMAAHACDSRPALGESHTEFTADCWAPCDLLVIVNEGQQQEPLVTTVVVWLKELLEDTWWY